MRQKTQKLLLEQTDKKLKNYSSLSNLSVPDMGWLRLIRKSLNVSLTQLASKLNISPQSVRAIEERERAGSLTIKSLRSAAEALNLKFIYVLLPKEKSLQAMINKRALELAREIVLRTSHTMKLEDQGVSKERIEKAIMAKAEELKNEMPKLLWD